MIQAFLFSSALIQLLKKISYMTYMYRLTDIHYEPLRPESVWVNESLFLKGSVIKRIDFVEKKNCCKV